MSNPFDINDQPPSKTARRDSLTKPNPLKKPQREREVQKVDDLKWAIKTISKKDFMNMMKANDRPPVIGWEMGKLANEIDNAVAEKDINSLRLGIQVE